jgi:hypothetical protein
MLIFGLAPEHYYRNNGDANNISTPSVVVDAVKKKGQVSQGVKVTLMMGLRGMRSCTYPNALTSEPTNVSFLSFLFCIHSCSLYLVYI